MPTDIVVRSRPRAAWERSLIRIMYRRFVVWRIDRLTRRARRIMTKAERLWAVVDLSRHESGN